MRWVVVVVALLVGCEPSRYGAYLTLDSAPAFDHVELYFGHTLESAGTGQDFATPKLGAARGTAYGRKYASVDRYDVEPTSETTLYVPPDGQNEVLGAYVVAVVSRGGQPVGIGEYFNFEVPTDEVHEYKIELVAYDPLTVERWGAEPGCIAWLRDRGSLDKAIVGVVHEDDRDCDDELAAADCNDLCTSGSALCDAASTLCFDSCALGCGTATACVPKTCLPALACDAACNKILVTERIQCAVDIQDPHVEIYVDTFNQQMCGTTFFFALPQLSGQSPPCIAPHIEFIDVAPAEFAYSVSAEPNGTRCMLTLDQFGRFETAHHMLVSFASQDALAPRKSVVVGVQPMAATMACDPTGYRVENAGPIFDCN